MPDYNGKPRERLPTLFEVLNRRSQPPVDLWSFYVFMREQYRGVDYLDFWLDVVQHLSLCRHYVRGLRQSILATSEVDGSSRASSVLLDTLIQEGGLNDADSHRLSAFLRGEDPTSSGTVYRLSALLDAMNAKEQGIADAHAPSSRMDNFISHVNTNVAERSRFQNDDDPNYYDKEAGPSTDHSVTPGPSSGFRGAMDAAEAAERHSSLYSASGLASGINGDSRYNQLANSPTAAGSPGPQSPGFRGSPSPRAGFNQTRPISAPISASNRSSNIHNSSQSPNETIERLFPRRVGDINDGSNYVSRQDIRQSSHRILVTYFIPGAEREIVLPARIMKSVKHAIEVEGRDDPEVFDEAREYAFQAMEREAFPSFLASRALGNLTPTGSLVRLIIGLIALFAGFWVAFILILLDWKPKVTRLWLILPFGVGAYGVCSSLYNLDPIMALVGYSESSARTLSRIREPFVRKLLVKRALFVFGVIIIVAAVFVVIFALVPGHRL